MTQTQAYIIEVINLVPDDSICFIQAPSTENSEFINLVTQSPFAYYNQIILTPSNKKSLIKIIINQNIEEWFHSIEMRFNYVLLFEGYDGMEYGTISKNLQLTDLFINNFIKKEMCTVSKDW